MKHGIAITILVLLGCASAYFAAAGWVIANLDSAIEGAGNPGGPVVYQGVTFENIYAARLAIEQERVGQMFAWTFKVPASLPLLMTAVSFGILGGMAAVLHKAIGAEAQTVPRIILKPLFGGFIGLMVLGISYVLPAVLTMDNGSIRPVSLAFLCLYGGAFSNRVFKWLEEKIQSLFTLNEKPANANPPP